MYFSESVLDELEATEPPSRVSPSPSFHIQIGTNPPAVPESNGHSQRTLHPLVPQKINNTEAAFEEFLDQQWWQSASHKSQEAPCFSGDRYSAEGFRASDATNQASIDTLQLQKDSALALMQPQPDGNIDVFRQRRGQPIIDSATPSEPGPFDHTRPARRRPRIKNGYPCDFFDCSRVFDTNCRLTKHRKDVHLDEARRRFQCDQCDRGFVSSKHLDRHLKAHQKRRAAGRLARQARHAEG